MARRKRNPEVVAENSENGAAEMTAESILDQTERGETEQIEEVAGGEGEHQHEGTVRCRVCGRILTADVSVVRGIGPLCASRVARALGVSLKTLAITDEEAEGYVAEEQVERAAQEVKVGNVHTADPKDFNPESYVHPAFPEQGEIAFVTLKSVGEEFVDRKGKSLGDFIEAFGGDRGRGLEPRAWYWTPLYVGRRRYLPAEVLLHADADLKDRRQRGDPNAKPGNENLEAEVVEQRGELVEAGS
jgi:hypothetical protein